MRLDGPINQIAVSGLILAALAGCGTRPRESLLPEREISESDARSWGYSLGSDEDFTEQLVTLAQIVKSSNFSIRSLMKAKRLKATCYDFQSSEHVNVQRCNFSWEKEK